MLGKTNPANAIAIVKENWLKPPYLVQYTNSRLLKKKGKLLLCEFHFPQKYAQHDFYLNDKKVLSSGEMVTGKRYFWSDRFYSLLEFYSNRDKITAYYLDITLPCYFTQNEIYIVDLKLDFFIFPDKKTYILLDEDELEEAVLKKQFNHNELKSCYQTRDFIKKCLESNQFDKIFTNYQKSRSSNWKRYQLLKSYPIIQK
ncbi:MAG: DUF402 domain-containing protein [Spirochaetes bacterium]|nr:DUF402 domain-containing protein [Spirochaetota bacterium]